MLDILHNRVDLLVDGALLVLGQVWLLSCCFELLQLNLPFSYPSTRLLPLLLKVLWPVAHYRVFG